MTADPAPVSVMVDATDPPGTPVDLAAELPPALGGLDAEVGALLRAALEDETPGRAGVRPGDRAGVRPGARQGPSPVRSGRRLGVAYSGGVDSGLLLALAIRHLGPERVLAVLGVSPSLAADERSAAHGVAAAIGAAIVEVRTHEGDVAAYRANGPDRCFHCKDELFTRISDEVAGAHGLTAIAYGENADDARRPDRPGSRAATNHSVLRPLAQAGLTKTDVRAFARALGLPNADKPAAPCLASRIPHFQRVDPAKLAQVEALEHDLRALGFGDCRVRHHGEIARIELLESDLERSMAPDVRASVSDAGRSAGFTFVAIDVSGIQSGAFTLPLVQVSDG